MLPCSVHGQTIRKEEDDLDERSTRYSYSPQSSISFDEELEEELLKNPPSKKNIFFLTRIM